MKPVETAPEDIPSIVEELREYFNTKETRSVEWRKKQLNGLSRCLDEHKDDWVKAMNDDMGSHFYEAELLIANVKSEIAHTVSNLEQWLKPESVSQPWALYPGSTRIVPEPYGVVCDFIPFNYPVYLGFSTLIPILGAGNVCLFKPSSNTPHCSKLYQELFPQYLDPRAVRVVCGPSSICTPILEQRFDFIFYTGSPKVGKTVMAAASKHLTPCLLELGGKSPVYVDKNCSMSKVCRRLAFGKFFNGGQTCVAPDYVLVHKDVVESFQNEFIATINEFYGDVSQYNDNITHIISERHFDRIVGLIDTCGGEILVNGLKDKSRLYMGPVLVKNPKLDSQMMTEEIFGPVLPFIEIEDEDAAIEFINKREKPLACYVLSSDDAVFDKFVTSTSSGALMMNDTVFHVSSPFAPFGGVGNSGMGQYHGKVGITTLSHMKPVLTHSTMIDISLRYPPYTEGHLKLVKKFC